MANENNIEQLSLSNSGINSISEKIVLGLNKNIRFLYLNKNIIKEIPFSLFENLLSLEIFDISSNILSSIPSEITNLMFLKELYIDKNKIANLPNSIGDLKNLKVLSASHNLLFFIPIALFKLENSLTELYLNNNMIKYIHFEIGKLSNLNKLYLHSNKFVTLPTSLAKLNQLQDFSLDWFKYINPPLPRVIKELFGKPILDTLRKMCSALLEGKMNEFAARTFLEFFSKGTIDIYSKDKKGKNMLHRAASDGDFGIIQNLLLGNYNLNELDFEGNTALNLSIIEKQFDIASLLIASGADISLNNNPSGGPIHQAIIKMAISIVEQLISSGININIVDLRGNTPLHTLVNSFNNNSSVAASIMNILFKSKCSLTAKNYEKWTPIHLAIFSGNLNCTKMIINQLKETKTSLNIFGGNNDLTPLHLACQIGNFKQIKLLIKEGCSPLEKSSKNEIPRALSSGNPAITKFLRHEESKNFLQLLSQKQIKFRTISNLSEVKVDSFSLNINQNFGEIVRMFCNHEDNYDRGNRNLKHNNKFVSTKTVEKRNRSVQRCKKSQSMINNKNLSLFHFTQNVNVFVIMDGILNDSNSLYLRYKYFNYFLARIPNCEYISAIIELLRKSFDNLHSSISIDLIYSTSFLTNQRATNELIELVFRERKSLSIRSLEGLMSLKNILCLQMNKFNSNQIKHQSTQKEMHQKRTACQNFELHKTLKNYFSHSE